jgi:hypothetical protein
MPPLHPYWRLSQHLLPQHQLFNISQQTWILETQNFYSTSLILPKSIKFTIPIKLMPCPPLLARVSQIFISTQITTHFDLYSNLRFVKPPQHQQQIMNNQHTNKHTHEWTQIYTRMNEWNTPIHTHEWTQIYIHMTETQICTRMNEIHLSTRMNETHLYARMNKQTHIYTFTHTPLYIYYRAIFGSKNQP